MLLEMLQSANKSFVSEIMESLCSLCNITSMYICDSVTQHCYWPMYNLNDFKWIKKRLYLTKSKNILRNKYTLYANAFIKCAQFPNHILTILTKGATSVSWWCNGKSDGFRNCSNWVQIPLGLLRSLLDKYPLESYEPPYPPSYGLSSSATVFLEGWIWQNITYKGW